MDHRLSATDGPTAVNKILCVEDDYGIANLIAEELADRGYLVDIARDGREGLAAVLADKPDLILSDIQMPCMDGFDLLRRLTAMRWRLGRIPLIFVTATADVECRLEARRLGADNYIVKPIDFDHLAAEVAASLAICDHGARPYRVRASAFGTCRSGSDEVAIPA